jgi:hypothetical protein
MAYELFKKTATRVDTPIVSLGPDGRIAINAALVRIFKEARIDSVVLLWDEENHRMAIKASHKNDKNSYAVSFSESRSGIIRAKSFLAYIRWTARDRQRLLATWNEKEKMLEARLPPHVLDSITRPAVRRS